jgi:hypothetical protein
MLCANCQLHKFPGIGTKAALSTYPRGLRENLILHFISSSIDVFFSKKEPTSG